MEFIVGDGVGELEAQDVVLIEAVPLEGVYDEGGLEGVFEVGETKENFFRLLRNQTDRLEPRKRPENVYTVAKENYAPLHAHSHPQALPPRTRC